MLQEAQIQGFTEDIHQPFLWHRCNKTWRAEGLELRKQLAEQNAAAGPQVHATVPPVQAPRTTDRVCGPDLLLSDVELEDMGEFVHQVNACIAAARAGDYSKLRSYGYSTITQAQQVSTEMGRKGRLPWASPYFKKYLGYIKSSTFVELPPAHLFLHGLTSALWTVATGKLSGWELKDDRGKESPFVFQREQLAEFKVQLLPAVTMPLLHRMQCPGTDGDF